MKPSLWKLLDSSLILQELPWLCVYREAVELPSGRRMDNFFRVVMPEFVVVVPFTETGELVMVRSYKHGLRKVSLSAPAGYIEEGESPQETARRELLEETGYEANEWSYLGEFMVDGNRQCGVEHVFLARNAVPVSLPSERDDAEVSEPVLMHPDHLLEAIRSGEVVLLPSVAAVSLALLTRASEKR